MNITEYEQFLRRQGYSTFMTASGALFMEIRPFYYTSFPFHREVSLERRERYASLLRSPLGLQYVTGRGAGRSALELMGCVDPGFDLASLRSSSRNQIKKGLKLCEIKEVPFSELAVTGIDMNRNALARQQWRGDHSSYTEPVKWSKYLEICQSFYPDVMAYGAYVDGSLAAYVILNLVDDACYISNFMSHSDFLSSNPNNALIYTTMKQILGSGQAVQIFLGLRAEKESLNHFKENMGLVPVVKTMNRWINPFVRPLLALHPTYRHYLKAGER